MNTSNTIHASRSHGSGGAHLGFGGRPRVCMNEVNDGAGGGGGNASPSPAPGDVSSTTGAPGTPPAGSGSPTGERLFTQAEMNAHVQDRITRDRASRGDNRAQPAPRQDATAAPSNSDVMAELARLRSRTEFNDAIADLGIPRAQQADMFDLYRAQSPTDAAAWASSKAPLFKGSSTTTTAPTTTTTTTQDPRTPAPQPIAAAAPRAPTGNAAPVAAGGLQNIYSITPEQFSGYSGAQLKQAHEANLAVAVSNQGAPPIRSRRKG